jgi:hypothetical protein
VHVSSVPKDVAHKIRDGLKASTADLVVKHWNALSQLTASKKILSTWGTVVRSVTAVLPPHGAKFAALLTVVGDLPPAWLLAASIGNVEADLRGDAVRPEVAIRRSGRARWHHRRATSVYPPEAESSGSVSGHS